MKARENIQWVVIRVLILLFLYSAIAKLLDYETSASELAKSPFLHSWANKLAWAVPLTELAVAIMLLIKKTRSAALHAYFFIMVAFTAYVYLMMKKAYYLPCACGGLLESELSWPGHLLLNGVFTLMAIASILLEGKYKKSDKEKCSIPKITQVME